MRNASLHPPIEFSLHANKKKSVNLFAISVFMSFLANRSGPARLVFRQTAPKLNEKGGE